MMQTETLPTKPTALAPDGIASSSATPGTTTSASSSPPLPPWPGAHEASPAPGRWPAGAVARCAALETAAPETTRMKPMITVGRTWRSVRVPE